MDIINDRRRRHKWSTEDRQLLCLFTKLFENSLGDATAIINHLIQESLQAEGYTDGMSTAIVDTQLHSMTRGSAGHAIWRMFRDLTISEVRKRFRESRDAIEDAALDLGITLRLRAYEASKLRARSYGPVKRHRRSPFSTAVLGHHISSTDTETEQTPRKLPVVTPRKPITSPLTPPTERSGGITPTINRRKAGPPRRVGEVFPASQDQNASDNESQRYPGLLYRFYNVYSQGENTPNFIRAGRFPDAENIPPPNWSRDAVWNHLERRREPSPYVSFRDNLRGCMFSAINAEIESNACITIVDLQSFLAACRQRWGGDDAAQMCPRLIERFGLRPGRNGSYSGRGEWLLYGEIQKEAIIATAHIRDILRYAHRSPIIASVLRLENFYKANTATTLRKSFFMSPPPMNFQAGKVVGDFAAFLNMPQEIKKQFSESFATAWRLSGYEKSRPNQPYDEYMRGVFDEEGSSDRLITSDDDEIAIDARRDDRQGVDSACDAVELVHFSSWRGVAAANDQDIIDAQLQSELASTLWGSAAISQSGTITDSNQPQRPAVPSIYINGTGDSGACIQTPRRRKNTRPGSSRPFIFQRPTVPGGSTNWEEVRSRETSPTVTEQSALDTFTAELLAKAEQCSTMGSVGRQPSATREASETVLAMRPGITGSEKNTRSRKSAPTVNPIILDLSSEDDNNNNNDHVRDLGFEITGFRAIDNTQGSLLRKYRRRRVVGTSPVRLD